MFVGTAWKYVEKTSEGFLLFLHMKVGSSYKSVNCCFCKKDWQNLSCCCWIKISTASVPQSESYLSV